MKITLHELKYLVAQIINEGFADDLKVLQQRYPNEADALSGSPFFDSNGQPTKWFKWLLSRFLPNPPKEEFALDHTIDSVQRYAQKEQALSESLKQQAFKEALVAAALPANKIRDISQLNVREMDGILDVLEKYKKNKKDRLKIDHGAISIEGDRLNKIGPWNIWMPTTRENSCSIVRVKNPETGEMQPSPCTWCTTRTDGSNLFYNYTADPNADIILYYLIKDNPEINNKENEDFISIGFRNGEPVTSGQSGGLTVRCDNKGLEEGDLKRIFGEDYANIINLLTKKTKEIGGQHPAKAKLVAASESLEGFNYLIKGLGREEKAKLALQVLNFGQRSGKINPDVEIACFKLAIVSKDKNIKRATIENPNCPPEILKKLINNDYDPNDPTPFYVLMNSNCPPNIQNNWELLINHKNRYVNDWLSRNANCPPEILEKLFNDDNDPDSQVAYHAFSNPNFPPNIKKDFELLSNHKNIYIRSFVAKNPNCPLKILEKFLVDDSYVKESLVYNTKCPPEILEKLLVDVKQDVVRRAVYNPNIASVAKNPDCPGHILTILYNASQYEIKRYVAQNPSCPFAVMVKIAHETDHKNLHLKHPHHLKDLKLDIIKNEKTWNKFIKKLSKDPDPDVKSAAQKEAQKRKLQLESLRKRIGKLIHSMR